MERDSQDFMAVMVTLGAQDQGVTKVTSTFIAVLFVCFVCSVCFQLNVLVHVYSYIVFLMTD